MWRELRKVWREAAPALIGFMMFVIVLILIGAGLIQITFQIPFWVALLITIGVVGIFLVKIALEKEPTPTHYEEDEYDPNATDGRWHWP